MIWQLCAAIVAALGMMMAYPIGQGAVPVSNTCDPCSNPVGSWGPWGQWSACHSNTFAQKVMTRTRSCSTTFCPDGVREEEASCSNVQYDQPQQAQWGQWGAWSVCSASCGGGRQTRQRACGCGVCQCQGASTEQQACNTQACTCNTCYNPVPAPAPVCNTCYNPVPAPIPQPAPVPQPAPPVPVVPVPVPSPSPVCTTCNNPVPAPSPCATCGPPQPYYNPYGNGKKKRELLISQIKGNLTIPH